MSQSDESKFVKAVESRAGCPLSELYFACTCACPPISTNPSVTASSTRSRQKCSQCQKLQKLAALPLVAEFGRTLFFCCWLTERDNFLFPFLLIPILATFSKFRLTPLTHPPTHPLTHSPTLTHLVLTHALSLAHTHSKFSRTRHSLTHELQVLANSSLTNSRTHELTNSRTRSLSVSTGVFSTHRSPAFTPCTTTPPLIKWSDDSSDSSHQSQMLWHTHTQLSPHAHTLSSHSRTPTHSLCQLSPSRPSLVSESCISLLSI